MKKYLIVLFGLFALLISSCTPRSQKDSKITKVTVAQWGKEKYLIYLPLYIAIEKGFFKDEGLEINLKYSGNDDQVFATVIKGDADFGVGDPVFTAIAREQGFNGKVIATIVNGVSIWGVTNNNSINPIDALQDLKGLRIGTFPAPSTNYTLINKTIIDNPILLKNTSIIQAPIGSQIALLENNAVDIAMELEPSVSLAISKGYKLVFSSPMFYGEFAFTGITTTEDYLIKNEETAQKFVNALEKAVQFCHNNTDEAVKIAKSLFPSIEGNVIEMAVNRMIKEKTLPEHVLTSETAWDNAIEVRKIVGDIKQTSNTNISVENKFAINAIKK
jgi:NitT/TauT family transport system substrate-binding protein